MKAIRYYSIDSRVDLCQSESNIWFIRSLEKSQYGYNWTKWKYLGKLNKAKRQYIEYQTLNGNEIKEYVLEFTFDGSFTYNVKLKNKRSVEGLKFRLPN